MKHLTILLAATLLALLSCSPQSGHKPRFLWIDASANFDSYAISDCITIGTIFRNDTES